MNKKLLHIFSKSLGILATSVLLGQGAQAQIQVACVGDSITYGQGASSNATKYEGVLQNLLGSGYVVSNYGHSGATMLKNGNIPYWNQVEYTNSTNANPNVVIIQLGTNDANAGIWTPHGSEFAGDAQALVDHYAALPAHPKIYICLPPSIYGVGNTRAINLENGVIPALRTVTGATLVDNYTPTRNAPWDFVDGVHPNDAGYVILGNDAYRAMTNVAPFLPSFLAVGPDNQTRILRRTDQNGSFSLQTIATDGTTVVSTHTFGPYPGWSPIALCMGPDNCAHVLWNNLNRTTLLWKFNTAGTSAVVSQTFPAVNLFLPRDVSVGADNLSHVLWDDTNNTTYLWRLSATDTNPVVSNTYTGDTKFAPKAIAVGADSLPHLLWSNPDGYAILWRLNSDGSSPLISQSYGPYTGYVPVDIGVGPNNKPQLLWDHGTFIVPWSLNSDGTTPVHYVTYVPALAYNRSLIDVGGDNNIRVLFNNTNGTVTLKAFAHP